MRISPPGDLARNLQTRADHALLSDRVTRLTEELTTGLRADRGRAVGGDFTAIGGIERSLSTLDAYRLGRTEAAQATGAIQTALGTAQDAARAVSAKLLSALQSPQSASVGAIATEARARFDAALTALNLRSGDRYLLAGVATDRRPLADAQTMLDALAAATAGQVTVSGMTAAIDAWFDAPAGGGGFLDSGYGGSATPLAPLQLGPDDRIGVTLTAADPAIRDVLKGLATAAMVAGGALPGDPQGRAGLLRAAGERLLSADAAMTGLRADLGAAEARIAEAGTAAEAEKTSLAAARDALIGADPYDTASALEDAQARIETLYTLTVRLSRLSLADLLR